MVTILITFVVTTVSNAKISTSYQSKVEPAVMNKEISLGSVTIYGDGIEGNTNSDAKVNHNIIVKISSDQENLDFNMSYSIQCDGEDDLGIAIVLLQSNGVSMDHQNTFTSDFIEGELKIEDVLVKKGDLLTFEILAIYVNTDPPFTRIDADASGSLVIKSKSIDDTLCSSSLIQQLQKFSLLSRAFS